MKLSKKSITLFGAALLFAKTALAGDTNKGTLNVSDDVRVEGQTLKPGKYTVEWNGTGPNVQVTISRGKNTVVTFPAHLTEEGAKNQQPAYGSATQPDGTRALTTIYIAGTNAVLQVDQSAAAQQSANQAAK